MAPGDQYKIVEESSSGARIIKALITILFIFTVIGAIGIFAAFAYMSGLFLQGSDPETVFEETEGRFLLQEKTYKSYDDFFNALTQENPDRKTKGTDPILEYETDFYNYKSEYYKRCEGKRLDLNFSNEKTSTLSFNYQNEEITYNVNLYTDLYEFSDNLKSQDCYFRGQYVDGYFADPYNDAFMKKVAQDFVLTLKEKYTDDEMVEIATLFVQSIAYGTDETQINRYPYETFFEEQGNCLDKSVILVYLLEELGYTSYIILGESTEYHALVGIACESGANMKVEGNNVCFIETTIFTPIGTAVDIEVEQVIPFSVGNNVYRGTSYGPSLVDDIETTKFEITQINQNVDVHIDNLGFIESDMCATDCVICDANGIDFERSNNEITSCNDANTYNNLVTEYNSVVQAYNSLIGDWYQHYYDMETSLFENVEIVQRR